MPPSTDLLRYRRLLRPRFASLTGRFPGPLSFPPMIAALSGMAGIAQGQPLLHVLVGGSLAFAASAIGLARLHDLWCRLSIEDKLGFGSARLRWALNEQGAVQSLRLGFQVSNTAQFPIEMHVESLHTTIGGRTPAKKRPERVRIVVPAHGNGWCDDVAVAVEPPARGQCIDGSLEFFVRYGRPGRRADETLGRRFQVSIRFNQSGDIDHWEWTEVERAEVVLKRHFLAI